MPVPQGPFAYIVGVQWSAHNMFAAADGFASVFTSRDGITWTDRGKFGQFADDEVTNWGSIPLMIWHKKHKMFYGLGQPNFGDEAPVVFRSSDGVTWQTVLRSIDVEGTPYWIQYDEGVNRIYIQVSKSNEPDPPTHRWYMSTNGTSWGTADRTSSFSAPIRATISDLFDEDKTVTVYARLPSGWSRNPFTDVEGNTFWQTRDGTIEISRNNKVSWSVVDTGLGIPGDPSYGVIQLAAGKGLLAAVGHKGVAVTRNGADWQLVLPKPGTLTDPMAQIGYASGAFVASGRKTEGITAPIIIYRSTDGFVWNEVTRDLYGQSLFVSAMATGRVPV